MNETASPAPEATQFLLGMDRDELRRLVAAHGLPENRADLLARWLYPRGAPSIDQMIDLPGAFRTKLKERFSVGRSSLVLVRPSADSSTKVLLELHDGQRVETVALPYDDRFACCVSSQVGCPVRCAFCATGRSGYTRNLTAGEIVDQVLAVQALVPQQLGSKRRVSHVVFMGMGEPLLNYEAVIKAIKLLTDEMRIGVRNITVSTVGYLPGIRRLTQEKLPVTLAVSLHAPDDELRSRLIPTMTRWSVKEIVEAARDFSNMTDRRVTFEYCLLRDTNDSEEHAQKLGQLLQGVRAHVNLIPYNSVDGLDFRPPAPERVQAFFATLHGMGIHVTQRVQRGADVDAACGQLRLRDASATGMTSAALSAFGLGTFAAGDPTHAG